MSLRFTLDTERPIVSYTFIRVTRGKFYIDHRSYGPWGLDFEVEIGPGVWS